jgi:hypothetical protein
MYRHAVTRKSGFMMRPIETPFADVGTQQRADKLRNSVIFTDVGTQQRLDRPNTSTSLRGSSFRDPSRSLASLRQYGNQTLTVARRIELGQSIESEAMPGATMRRKQAYVGDPEPEPPIPHTLLSASATQPRLDRAGSPVTHSILGSRAEFDAQRRARLLLAGAEDDADDVRFRDQLGLRPPAQYNDDDNDDDAADHVPRELAVTSDASSLAHSSDLVRPRSVARSSSQLRAGSAWLSDTEQAEQQRRRIVERAVYFQREHARNQRAAVALTGKEATMMRSVSEHRDKMIAAQEAMRARPPPDDGNPRAWQLDLRGAGEESIRVGSAVNELYVLRKLGDLGPTIVRRAPPPALAAFAQASADSLRLHRADADAADALGARAPAHGARAESAPTPGARFGMAALPLARGAEASLAATRSLASLREADDAPMRPSTAMPYVTRAPAAGAGSSLSRQSSAPTAAAAPPQPRVTLDLGASQLLINTAPGASATCTVVLRNAGDAAVHFTWRRARRDARPTTAEGGRVLSELPSRDEVAAFRPLVPSGALEPAAELAAAFAFDARAHGRFAEEFELHLTPDARGPPPHGQPLQTVRLVALCAEPVNALALRRRRVDQVLQASVCTSMVHDLLLELVARVPPPPKPAARARAADEGLVELEQARRWAAANGGLGLHFTPQLGHALEAIALAAGVVAPAQQLDARAVRAALAAADERDTRVALALRLDGVLDAAGAPPAVEINAELSALVYAGLCALAEQLQARAEAIGARLKAPARPFVAPAEPPPVAPALPSGSIGLLRLDVDWVGTRALHLPAAALASVRGMPALSLTAAAADGGGGLMPSPFEPEQPPAAPARAGAFGGASAAAAARRAPNAGAAAEAARAELAAAVRELLLELAGKVASHAPELSALNGEGVAAAAVQATPWAEATAFGASWAQATQGALRGWREEGTLIGGLEKLLALKPVAKGGAKAAPR